MQRNTEIILLKASLISSVSSLIIAGHGLSEERHSTANQPCCRLLASHPSQTASMKVYDTCFEFVPLKTPACAALKSRWEWKVRTRSSTSRNTFIYSILSSTQFKCHYYVNTPTSCWRTSGKWGYIRHRSLSRCPRQQAAGRLDVLYPCAPVIPRNGKQLSPLWIPRRRRFPE